MFGYVKVLKEDLKIRDFRTYRKKYCSLCQMLGKKYGIIYRSIISYDMIFLILVFENFKEESLPLSFKCPINPLKKIEVNISEHVEEYCAFINYYLTVLKVKDDVMDENRFISKIMLKIFEHNSSYKQMVEMYGDKLNGLFELMDIVNILEQENAKFDMLSNSFGTFFAEIFKMFFDFYIRDTEEINPDLYMLCFNLGKWIYIMDAYDDYNKDIQSNQFNLLKEMLEGKGLTEKIKAHKKILMINEILISKMKESFFKISWNKHEEILCNIISEGCMNTYLKILHKNFPEMETIILKKAEE